MRHLFTMLLASLIFSLLTEYKACLTQGYKNDVSNAVVIRHQVLS